MKPQTSPVLGKPKLVRFSDIHNQRIFMPRKEVGKIFRTQINRMTFARADQYMPTNQLAVGVIVDK